MLFVVVGLSVVDVDVAGLEVGRIAVSEVGRGCSGVVSTEVFDQTAEEVVYFVVLADALEMEFGSLSTGCSVGVEPVSVALDLFVVGMVVSDGTVVVAGC